MAGLLEHSDTYHQSEQRKFKCEQCGRSYRHAGSLANHRKTHDVGLFQCHVCSRKLSNALALKSHLRIHTSRKKYPCTICGKDFRLASQLATHQTIHRDRESEVRSRGQDNTESPAESHYKAEDLPHLDEVEFDIIPHLQPDIKLGVALVNTLGNGVTSEHVPSSTGSDTVADDDGNRPFKCDLCGKTYRHHGSLVNHKKTHQMGVFECPVCFKQFSNLAALTSHQRTHSRNSEADTDCKSELPSPVMLQNSDADVHFCHLCQVAFLNDDEFQNHILLHDSPLSFELPTSLSEGHSLTYSDTVAHSPQSNIYPPSDDTPPLPPLLADDFDQSEGSLEHDHVRAPNSLDDNSFMTHAQVQPVAPPSENLSQSEQGVENLKAKDSDGSDRRFKCHICGKSYRHASSLINHKRCHQTGIFQCSVCQKNYPHLAALRSHLRTHKGKLTSFPVSAEGDWLSSEPLTQESQQGCFQERRADGTSHLPQYLLDSDQQHVNESSASEFCEQFENSFPEDSSVHLAQSDTLTERHMCADCGKTFVDIAGIKSHTCPLLNQQYQTTSNGLYDHMDFHNTKHQYFLASDNVGFEEHDGSSDEMYFTEQIFQDNSEGGRVQCEEEEDDDGEMYQCSVCGNHYTSMNALRSHLQGHTQTHDPSAASGPPACFPLKQEDVTETQQGDGSLIICSSCGESFSKQQQLQAHQLLHCSAAEVSPAQITSQTEADSVICGRCGDLHHHSNCTGGREAQEEQKREEKEQHELLQNSSDGGKRQYKCEQCDRSYRHSASLLNHKKSHKTGVFRCSVCQKRFYNLLALKNHQRTHFDVKKHSCTECGKAFKIHKQLLNHQRAHQQNKTKINQRNKQSQTQSSGKQRKRIGVRHKRRPALGGERSSDDLRPYVCDQCGRSYRHAGSLVNHKNCHKMGEYHCTQCSNTYSNRLAMMNHLRTHSTVKKHRCQDCGKVFRGHKQLLGHTCSTGKKNRAVRGKVTKQVKNLTCSRCSRTFPSAEKLTAHACSSDSAVGDGKPAEKDERPFRCNVCGRSYRHASSLLNHKNTHKTGHFSCSFCAKSFSNPMALRNHTRIHTQKKKFVCSTCGKAFRLSSILYNHQKTHVQGGAHHSCKMCGKRFRGRSGLKRHRCYHNSSSTLSPDSRDKCFTCDQCGRSYRHAGSLLNHKKTHSSDLLHCSLCLKTFTDPLELESHSQMSRHCCPDCGKTFCEFSHLQSHMEVHSKSLPYFCKLCQQNFPNQVSFQQHQTCHDSLQGASLHQRTTQMQDVGWDSELESGAGSLARSDSAFNQEHGFPEDQDEHENSREEKSHVCEHCGRTYRHASSLLNHKNSHKTGTFFCPVCQKEFTNLMALKNHKRIHTEPKRYQCLECGKAFRVSTQLICHRRMHTKEKPFSCLLCDRRFSSKSNLRHHQKTHQNPPQTPKSSFNMDAEGFMGLGVDPLL